MFVLRRPMGLQGLPSPAYRTGSDKSNYQLLNAPGARVRTAIVDGNRVVLQISSMPKEPFDIIIKNVSDTPELWLLKGRPANSVPAKLKVSVPGS